MEQVSDELKRELDLTRKVCHVCGWSLKKALEYEQEWCMNDRCVLFEFRFNIPYIIP